LERLKAIKSKRPKTVIDHILQYGFITTELEQKYGYRHPPRAARDVREQGIPLETFRVKNKEGRTIAAYRFADLSEIHRDRLGGRKAFSKEFKDSLIRKAGSNCSVCLEQYEKRYLQIDHRIPYQVAGDVDHARRVASNYMLLCGSCNRAESWSCEHCANWLEEKSPQVCQSCYRAHPESYKHIALRIIRRLDVIWTEHKVAVYEKLRRRVEALDETMPDYVKAVIKKHLEE
jgi:hypothetical protein